MKIKRYKKSDCRELSELFHNTVHLVNAGDYTKEQLDARSTGQVDLEKWNRLIAAALCDQLERRVRGNITTHASVTAEPFFEKRGYKVVREQKVRRQGIFLTNFVMEKIRQH